MKILVALWHPAHVHTFKNVIKKLNKKDHEIRIVAIKKDITLKLLDLYDFDYEIIGKSGSNLNKIADFLKITYRLWKVSKKFEPDVLLSRGSTIVPNVSRLLNIPYISFIDSEVKFITDYFSFIDYIITPENCDYHVKSQLTLNLPTYKELAYLHPNEFTPNKSSLEKLGIKIDEKFSLLRFAAYEAWHDVGQYGINQEMKANLVKNLEEYGDVYISSEKELADDLKEYQLDIPYDKIHDILYYANLFIGDSQTMTTEAAVLGTPAIRCNSFVGEEDMSNFIELENEYGLIYNYRDPKKAMKKASELIKDPKLKEKWAEKRNKLLDDKIDLTSFLIWFIDNYPESADLLKENKNYYHNVVK